MLEWCRVYKIWIWPRVKPLAIHPIDRRMFVIFIAGKGEIRRPSIFFVIIFFFQRYFSLERKSSCSWNFRISWLLHVACDYSLYIIIMPVHLAVIKYHLIFSHFQKTLRTRLRVMTSATFCSSDPAINLALTNRNDRKTRSPPQSHSENSTSTNITLYQNDFLLNKHETIYQYICYSKCVKLGITWIP